MDNWFTIDEIDVNTYIISEYRHWEETQCYLLNGKFPLSIETIKKMIVDRCDLPDGFNVNNYEFFQGMPTKVLTDHDIIDIGSREIEVLHTPGHSPGHLIMVIGEYGYKKHKDVMMELMETIDYDNH